MIQKKFITSDGKQHTSMRLAQRHEAMTALEMFLREKLSVHTDQDGIDRVDFSGVCILARDCADRLVELSQVYFDAKNARDFTREEVDDWVILKMAKVAFASGHETHFSPAYIRESCNRVWNVLAHGGVVDGMFTDLQCDLAYRAKQHFLED